MDVINAPGFFTPPPVYRRAQPPLRERASAFVGDVAGWTGWGPGLPSMPRGGVQGLGEADPTGPTPAEVVANPAIEQAAPPSTYAVAAFLEGQPGSGARLLGLTALRAVFILPGLWLASSMSSVKMSGGQLVAFSLASSATITGGMIGWYKLNEHRKRMGG